jgi:ATP-dependent RNA helicase SUPV3L1/SUV3
VSAPSAVAAKDAFSTGETGSAAESTEEIAADADVADAVAEPSLPPFDGEHASEEAQPAPEIMAGAPTVDEPAVDAADASSVGADAEASAAPVTTVTAAAPDEPAVADEAAVPEELAVAADAAAQAPESASRPSDPPAVAAAEPDMIEVWRPGRAEGRSRPPRRQRDQGRHFHRHGRPESAAPSPAPEGAPAAPVAAETPPASGGEAIVRGEADRSERHSRHRRRERGEQRFDRPRREGDRPANTGRQERQDRRPDRREKAPDPNSPFAQLAGLKAQLEAEAKERR